MYRFFFARAIVWLSSLGCLLYFSGLVQLYKLGFVEGMIQPDETMSLRGIIYPFLGFTLLDAFIILLEPRYNEILKELDVNSFKMLTIWEVMSGKGFANFVSNVRDCVTKLFKDNEVKTFLGDCIIVSISIIFFEFLFFNNYI